MTKIRILPIAIVAILAFAGLRVVQLVPGIAPLFSPTAVAVAQEAEEGAMAEEPEAGADTVPTEEEMLDAGESVTPGGPSDSEAGLLSRLRDRRKSLDERERELDMREALLAASEKRIEARIEELQAIEARIQETIRMRGEQEDQERKDLIKMYEQMKPKNAAKIFDRLNLNVLETIVRQMNPRKMADVLANMDTEAAEKLTVRLADPRDTIPRAAQIPPAMQQQAPSPDTGQDAELPKIGG